MPSVTFYKKDSPDDEYLIMLSFTFNRKRLRLSTEQKVKRKYWNAEKQKAISAFDFDAEELNFRLKKIADFLYEEYRTQLNNKIIPSAETLRKAYEIFINRRSPDAIELLPYIDQFLERYKNKYSLKTRQKFSLLKIRLKDFQVKTRYKVDFNTITKDFYYKFWDYLATEKSYHDNTFGDMIKKLKTILTEAFEDGISTCVEHHKKYFQGTG